MAAPTSPWTRSCPVDADDKFGPRVNIACRVFDFTLLFEDAFFVALPAAIFLLLWPWRLWALWQTPTRAAVTAPNRLLASKLTLLFALFGLHLAYLHFSSHTKLSVAAGLLSAFAILGAGVLSFIEDRRSVRPSDLLVLYLSASAILFTPRLRSLWLSESSLVPVAKILWTIIVAGTVIAVVLESLGKSRSMQPSYYQKFTKEETAGFWSRGFFVWLLPFFQLGFSRILRLQDVPKVDHNLTEEVAWSKLNTCWHRTAGRYRLVRATFTANLWPFFSAVPPRIAQSAFMLCQPFLIGTAISNLSTPAEDKQDEYGHALIGAFVLVYLGIAVSRALYRRQTNRMITRIRSGLTAMIYRHTTTLRVADVQDSAALTLMGTDVERIVNALRFIHEVWASIPEVAVAVWLLARQVSYAALMPLVICLASVAGASMIGARSGPAQKAWNERVEKRIAVTAKMLGDMKAVKLLGLSNVLGRIIVNLRKVEIDTSERFRYLTIWEILVGNAPATLAPLTTFAVYAIIATVNGDKSLLSVQAFTSLSLISLVTNPLNTFCQALPACLQAVACFRRIEAYCSRESVFPRSNSGNESRESLIPLRDLGPSPQGAESQGRTLASFESTDIAWSTDATEPVLHNLNLKISSGFTAIIGPVGSGKSTLLETLIGETVIKRGSLVSNLPGTAFCPQTPWIADETIRHNITGTADFDFNPKWYDFSIESCGLQQDLARLPAGDQTVAGSNGSSLSGGQRQRVALARAVYSRLPVVILDDVTSGLDPTTFSVITTRLFGDQGHFRKAGISVVLATHSRRLLPYVDEIIVLDNGEVVDQGSYNEIMFRSAELVESEDVTNQQDIESLEGAAEGHSHAHNRLTSQEPQDSTADDSIESDMQRRQGSWAVYTYYFRSAGVISMIFWAIFTLVGSVATSYMTIWIERWSNANSAEPNQQLGFYLGVYAALCLVAILGMAGELWTFVIKIITNTALHLHLELLEAVLKTPFAFFQSTDTGSITNRFSQDMDLIDMTLPMYAIQFTTAATTCLVQLVIICVLGKYLAAVVPALAAVLYVLQKYYLRSSRQLRLLNIEAKAPLYKIFIETVSGISTIRSFHWQTPFHKKHRAILDDAQKPFYMLMCIQQWLALVLDLIVGAIAVILVTLATSLAGSISPGALGVGLVLILEFSELITQALQAWTKMETSIGAVTRVQQFVEETPSDPTGTVVTPATWPARGAISFNKLSASYSSDNTNLILRDITLRVSPGEKLAICGASGSGKTSFVMALLRMTGQLSPGAITIDGVDIAGMSAGEVCERINVIPQEPFFMPGTVRFNLDPRGRAPDGDIEAALRRVGLWGRVQGNGSGGGLDAELIASKWSQGEMQLLALARALLVPSRILVLDEATSSVDDKTEAVMQEVIDTEWRQQTVIAVLHRFAHIKQFDRVAVLDCGRLIECDTPQALLDRQSRFRELYRAYNSGI